jgi:transposase
VWKRLHNRRRDRRHQPLRLAAQARRLHRPLPAGLPIGRTRPGGPLAKQGPRYLRWALVEAATHACTTAVYRDRYQQIKARIGKQRGAKVGQIDLARRLSDASWHMLSRDQPFASKGATDPVAA